MTSPVLLTRVVAPTTGAWTYLDMVGRVSAQTFGWTHPGGPSSAEISLDCPANSHIPALTQGSTLTIHRGAGQVFNGVVATIARDAPWKIQCDGIAGLATREPVAVAGSLDAIVDQAITNGLPWTRPASLSTNTWADSDGAGATLATTNLDQVLTSILTAAGKRWVVSVDGVVKAVTDPTAPTLVIRAATAPVVTLNNYATEVIARYAVSTGGIGTVRVNNAAAAARFGRVAVGIDLSSQDLMTSASAIARATAYLATLTPSLTIAGDFPVTVGQVTTGSGAPVDLALVRPGVMARVQLVDAVRDAMLVPTTNIDLVIGATKYDSITGVLTISPMVRTLTPAQIMFGGATQ